METAIVYKGTYRGYVGIRETKMETTKFKKRPPTDLVPSSSSSQSLAFALDDILGVGLNLTSTLKTQCLD